MATGALDAPSTLFVQSTDPDLKRSFYRRFPKTRESYDRRKEEEIVAIVSESTVWKHVGKPCFRRHPSNGIVLRKAPSSKLHPTGHVTVCVPYELSFDVAVSQDTFTL